MCLHPERNKMRVALLLTDPMRARLFKCIPRNGANVIGLARGVLVRVERERESIDGGRRLLLGCWAAGLRARGVLLRTAARGRCR